MVSNAQVSALLLLSTLRPHWLFRGNATILYKGGEVCHASVRGFGCLGKGWRVSTLHSFYVVSLREGAPIYSRKWTESAIDSAVLSGFLASLDQMAVQVASQHVNVVNLSNRRLFFQADEPNGLLLVFVADTGESPGRFRKYLSILDRQFVKIFGDQLARITEEGVQDAARIRSFDGFVDDLVGTVLQGESTLEAAKNMDLLELFAAFINAILQHFLTADTRNKRWSEIQAIFEDNIATTPALASLHVDRTGVVYFDEIDPKEVRNRKLRAILFSIFETLIAFVKRAMPKRTYQGLVFQHLGPVIRAELERLRAYSLTEQLVVTIL